MNAALPLEERLDSVETLERHLAALLSRDARLAPVHAAAGTVRLRIDPPGFAGIAKIVIGQQVSVASASAIWSRFARVEGALDPLGYLALDEEAIGGIGLSGGKKRTIRGLAEAAASGALDFDRLHLLPAAEAVAELTRHKGIGPWTAEVYLMFCAAHPDVFPAGDLALQKAVMEGLGLPERPDTRQLVEIARQWAPHRAAAALLFWRYFAATRDREGIAP